MTLDTSNNMLLKVPEVARRLSLGEATIRRMIHARQMPAMHVGRAVRIPVDELQAWISTQTEKAEVQA